jgi:serpin B
LLAATLFVTSCAGPAAQASEAKSNLDRETSPNVSGAFDLYQVLSKKEGNLFFSPYSISLALAMTYAGAMSETEREMADTLHFTLSQERLHEALNALDILLESRGEGTGDDDPGFRLNIANAILGLLDYVGDPEGSRQIINDWVSDQTEGKIKDLIPPGVIDATTRLVLANAIYFKANWAHQFDEGDTMDGQFTLLDGSTVHVPLMTQLESFQYMDGAGFQAIELPYTGFEMSMVIILPEEGEFDGIEAGLDAEFLNQVVSDFNFTSLTLTMPKFEYESEFGLSKTLIDMGMPTAFGDGADFSGMDGTRNLYIKDVIEMKIDRPFIYAIRDIETGSILFLGRVANPSD